MPSLIFRLHSPHGTLGRSAFPAASPSNDFSFWPQFRRQEPTITDLFVYLLFIQHCCCAGRFLSPQKSTALPQGSNNSEGFRAPQKAILSEIRILSKKPNLNKAFGDTNLCLKSMSFKRYLIKMGILCAQKSQNNTDFTRALTTLCRLIFASLAGNCACTWLILLAPSKHVCLQWALFSFDTINRYCSREGRRAEAADSNQNRIVMCCCKFKRQCFMGTTVRISKTLCRQLRSGVALGSKNSLQVKHSAKPLNPGHIKLKGQM